MAITKLYRGDSLIKNRKTLQFYKSAGLLTKLGNAGDPAYVERNGLLESVRAHIKADSESEEVFQKRTLFFSFSANEERAKYYAADKQIEKLKQCEQSETRYVFTLDISKCKPVGSLQGVYCLEYECDNSLIEGPPYDIEIYGYDILHHFYQAQGQNKCRGCNNKQWKHRLLLIEVVAYLKAFPSQKKYSDALQKAQLDEEWLVMPIDYNPEIFGTSMRIPRTPILSAQYFYRTDDPPRNMFEGLGGADNADLV